MPLALASVSFLGWLLVSSFPLFPQYILIPGRALLIEREMSHVHALWGIFTYPFFSPEFDFWVSDMALLAVAVAALRHSFEDVDYVRFFLVGSLIGGASYYLVGGEYVFLGPTFGILGLFGAAVALSTRVESDSLSHAKHAGVILGILIVYGFRAISYPGFFLPALIAACAGAIAFRVVGLRNPTSAGFPESEVL